MKLSTNTSKKPASIYFMILCAFCISVLIFAFSLGINGNDFWWHIKAGEWITSHLSVPTTDIFSWYGTSHGLDWTSHEWMSEVILYLIMKIGGVIGVFVFSLIVALTLFIIFIKAAGEDIQKNLTLSYLYCLLLVCLLYTYCYGRPQIFSYLLLVAELCVLYHFKANENSKIIWLIPIIGCLWANLHGGSSNLTYILCIIFIFSGAFKFNFGKIQSQKFSRKQLITTSIVTVLSIAFICINPHGISMLTYPFENMSDSLMLNMIIEWHAPDAKELGQLIFFFVPVIGVSINLIATEKKIDCFDFLIYGFFTYMFFRSTRFIVFFVLASAFYAFKYLIPAKSLPEYKGTRPEKMVASMLFGICFIFACFSLYNCTVTYHSEKGLIKTVLNDDFIELVKSEQPEHLYSDYNFGETLIYNDIPVFVDSRADVYSGEVLSDYYSISMLYYMKSDYGRTTYVDEIMDKYDFDAFLITPSRPLFTYLCSHPEQYELVKYTKKAAYFKVVE
ncbi:MAG: hypothetical protein ACI4DS_05505 [Eubacterium sp.]